MSEILTRRDITKVLADLGIVPGDIILVQCLPASLGELQGGAEAVVDALLDAVGAEGTVVVPTLTGSPEHSRDNPPQFDVRYTPTRDGEFPEVFRQRWGAVRSLHPTHSVACIGPMAQDLARGHEHSRTPCGRGTPYYRMADDGGKIVLVGLDLSACVTMHTVEEIVESPWHLLPGPVSAVITDEMSQRRTVRIWIHRWGIERNFPVLEPVLLERGIMRTGQMGQAEVRIIAAVGLIETGVELLKENPTLLLADPGDAEGLTEEEPEEEDEELEE